MTTEDQDDKEAQERALKMAELVIQFTRDIGKAKLTNGEEIDLYAAMLGLHMLKAQALCGPDTVVKVLNRFVSRLTIMHPNLQGFVIEK